MNRVCQGQLVAPGTKYFPSKRYQVVIVKTYIASFPFTEYPS